MLCLLLPYVPDRAYLPLSTVRACSIDAAELREPASHARMLAEASLCNNGFVASLPGICHDAASMHACAGRKLLVFAHHTSVLDALEEAARKMRVPDPQSGGGATIPLDHMRIDGSTSAQARAALVRQFQEQPRCRLALLSLKAAGVRAHPPLPLWHQCC